MMSEPILPRVPARIPLDGSVEATLNSLSQDELWRVAYVGLAVAAILGEADEWYPGADYLDTIADTIALSGLPYPGSLANKNEYRNIVDRSNIVTP